MCPPVGGTPFRGIEADTPLVPADDDEAVTGLHSFASVAASDDALFAARNKLASADARLAEAHDEAQSIIGDAVAQANLLARNATRVAERLLADAERDAATARAGGDHDAQLTRAKADEERAAAWEESQQAREALTAELAERRADHERQLLGLHEAARAEIAAQAAEAEQERTARIAAATAELDAELAATRTERAALHDETEARRVELAREVKLQLDTASAEAAHQIAAAEEHTRWAQETVRGLLEAAEMDAARIRAISHQGAADSIRRTRVRVATALATSRARLTDRVDQAEQHAAAVTRESDELFERSLRDADRVRERAARDANRIVTEAEDRAAEHVARAERRLAEAEAGAKTIREQVAGEVTSTQEELSELWRTARAEQATASESARAEADEVRRTARKLLADARAEVATLSRRRDTIVAELDKLSGVIEALAVAENEPADNAPDRDVSPVSEPESEDAEASAGAEPMSLLEEMMRSE